MNYPHHRLTTLTMTLLLGALFMSACQGDDDAEDKDTAETPKTEQPQAAVSKLRVVSPALASVFTEANAQLVLSIEGAPAHSIQLTQNGQAKPAQTLDPSAMLPLQHTFELELEPGANTVEITTLDEQGQALDQEGLVLFYDLGDAPGITLDQSYDNTTTLDAQLTIAGQAEAARAIKSVELIVNGATQERLTPESVDQSVLAFSWQAQLNPGENTVEIVATDAQDQQAKRAMKVTRQRDEQAPELSIAWPRDGQSVNARRLLVQGSATDEDQVKEITVQYKDQQLSAQPDAQGRFQLWLTLDGAGQQSFTISATDRAGQRTEKSVAIHLGQRLGAGGAHGGALINGAVWTWGRNNKGQAGLGYTSSLTSTDVAHPIAATKLISLMQPIVSLAFSQNASLALDDQGKLWAWGDNANGQLCLGLDEQGQPDTQDRLEPTLAPGLDSIIAISRGYSHTLLLKADGTVWACGKNTSGQLGDGTTEARAQAVQVTGLANIVQISAGSESSFAIDDQGKLWAWGRNRYGNLGQGTEDTEAHAAPSQVPGLQEVISVAQGRDHTIALQADGQLKAWGLNASGQAGAADTESNVTAPTTVSLSIEPVAVHASGNQSFIEDARGRLWGWGQNGFGNLGTPIQDDLLTIQAPVFGLEGLTDAVIGPLHGFARASEEVILAWGWSFEGSLGGGDSIINRWGYRIPVLVQLTP